MNNKSINTGIILGGIISLVSIIFISSSSNNLLNTDFDSQTNIWK